MHDIAAEIEADFLRWELFDKTPRVASHSDIGVIELMPTSDGVTYGFKYVNGHPVQHEARPANRYRLWAFGRCGNGLSGAVVGNDDPDRAAHGGHFAQWRRNGLAPKGAHVMALIGNGAQAEFQALAFKAICGVDEVRLYDLDPEATAEMHAQPATGAASNWCPAQPRKTRSLGAQIITTVTADKQYATILTDNMVGAGVHINAVGGDCPGKTELHKDILLRSGIFVEYPPQTRVEGEIQQLPADHPVTELWEVIAGQDQGAHRCAADHPVRQRGLCHRRL